MSLNKVYNTYGEKLSPPYNRGEILDNQSLRSYLEDIVCGAVKEIARKVYGEDVRELEYEIDGRMRLTKISVVSRTERKLRLNPDIFTYTDWETIQLLDEAVEVYLKTK